MGSAHHLKVHPAQPYACEPWCDVAPQDVISRQRGAPFRREDPRLRTCIDTQRPPLLQPAEYALGQRGLPCRLSSLRTINVAPVYPLPDIRIIWADTFPS